MTVDAEVGESDEAFVLFARRCGFGSVVGLEREEKLQKHEERDGEDRELQDDAHLLAAILAAREILVPERGALRLLRRRLHIRGGFLRCRRRCLCVWRGRLRRLLRLLLRLRLFPRLFQALFQAHEYTFLFHAASTPVLSEEAFFPCSFCFFLLRSAMSASVMRVPQVVFQKVTQATGICQRSTAS